MENKIHEGQPNQTADQDTQGAEWELAKTEKMARSVGGDKSSPTLAGGKGVTKSSEKKEVKGGVRITDNTGKSAAPAGETNPKNPTTDKKTGKKK